jgi:putative NADH-flavin reductase
VKIAVVGAAGMVGSRVVTESLRRGHDVTAVFRSPVSVAGVRAVQGDATDRELMDGLLSGVDVVVAATRPRPGEESTAGPTTKALLDAALATRTRIIVVGGAAPLKSPDGGLVLDDSRYVPTHIRPIAAASLHQFEICREHPADWVYLSPPALLEPGERTGTYRRGHDELLTDPSRISAEDLAVAVLDELEEPGADRHFTVAW